MRDPSTIPALTNTGVQSVSESASAVASSRVIADNPLSRFYAWVGPTLGLLYLWFCGAATLAVSAMGLAASPYASEKYAMWLTLLSVGAFFIAGATLRTGRTPSALVVYVLSVLCICWLFASAQVAFMGNEGDGFNVPSWPPILLNCIIATALGGSRVRQMWNEMANTPITFSQFMADKVRPYGFGLIAIIVVSLGSGCLARSAGIVY